MSIINDALKKASKDNRDFQKRSTFAMPKLGRGSASAGRPVARRWLFWTATGVVGLMLVIFAVNSFQGAEDPVQIELASSEPQALPSISYLRSTQIQSAKDSSGFHLSGILYDQDKPLAIINDRILEKGGLVDGAQLLEIQSNFVRLSLNGKEFELKID